jgi:hypothetical protein
VTNTLAPMGRPKKSEPTKPIRLPESVVKRIARIAAHRGQDPGDYVAERFVAMLDADERKMLKEIEEERKHKGGE